MSFFLLANIESKYTELEEQKKYLLILSESTEAPRHAWSLSVQFHTSDRLDVCDPGHRHFQQDFFGAVWY